MISIEGELVPLKTRIKPSQANGAVEKWLVQVRGWWMAVRDVRWVGGTGKSGGLG